MILSPTSKNCHQHNVVTNINGADLKTNIQRNVGISYHQRTNNGGEHYRLIEIERGRRPSIYSLVDQT